MRGSQLRKTMLAVAMRQTEAERWQAGRPERRLLLHWELMLGRKRKWTQDRLRRCIGNFDWLITCLSEGRGCVSGGGELF